MAGTTYTVLLYAVLSSLAQGDQNCQGDDCPATVNSLLQFGKKAIQAEAASSSPFGPACLNNHGGNTIPLPSDTTVFGAGFDFAGHVKNANSKTNQWFANVKLSKCKEACAKIPNCNSLIVYGDPNSNYEGNAEMNQCFFKEDDSPCHDQSQWTSWLRTFQKRAPTLGPACLNNHGGATIHLPSDTTVFGEGFDFAGHVKNANSKTNQWFANVKLSKCKEACLKIPNCNSLIVYGDPNSNYEGNAEMNQCFFKEDDSPCHDQSHWTSWLRTFQKTREASAAALAQMDRTDQKAVVQGPTWVKRSSAPDLGAKCWSSSGGHGPHCQFKEIKSMADCKAKCETFGDACTGIHWRDDWVDCWIYGPKGKVTSSGFCAEQDQVSDMNGDNNANGLDANVFYPNGTKTGMEGGGRRRRANEECWQYKKAKAKKWVKRSDAPDLGAKCWSSSGGHGPHCQFKEIKSMADCKKKCETFGAHCTGIHWRDDWVDCWIYGPAGKVTSSGFCAEQDQVSDMNGNDNANGLDANVFYPNGTKTGMEGGGRRRRAAEECWQYK